MPRTRRESRIASTAARRSPETSVRSEASIATSVPVPIASPRSACASAGASLTPSPTIATTSPASCNRRTSATFPAGSTSATTRSTPTWSATPRAIDAVSPVNSTGVNPSDRSSAIASRLVGLTRSSTTSRARSAPSQLTPSRSTVDLDALDGSGDASTRRGCGSRVTAGSVAELARAPPRRPPAQPDARSRPRRRPRAAAPRPALAPFSGSTSTSRILPLGDRAGLVEHDRRRHDASARAPLGPDEDSELRAAAGPDQQGGRRGEAERARAGDDEDGDRRREGRRTVARHEKPAGERRQREQDHDRDEDGRNPVDEALDRRLARLRLCDEARDLRQRGVRADPRRPHDQPAVAVDRRRRRPRRRARRRPAATRRSASTDRPRTTPPRRRRRSRASRPGARRTGRRPDELVDRRRPTRRRPGGREPPSRPGRGALGSPRPNAAARATRASARAGSAS